MRLRHSNEAEIDVWPAFTDFLTSVLIIVVFFVFGILFSNIARSMVRRHNEFEDMQLHQQAVRQQLQQRLGEKRVEMYENGSLQRIILRVDEQGGGGVLFQRGSATLSVPGQQLLQEIAKVLVANRAHYDTIQVEGHTDDVPIGGKYASNWELSAARAGAVVAYIIEESMRQQPPGLEPWRFSANGAAEYHPYGVNESAMSLAPADNPRSGPRLDYVVRANQVPGSDPHQDNPAAQLNRRIEIVLTYRVKAAAR